MPADERLPLLALDVDGVVVLDEPTPEEALEYSVTAWGRWRREIRVPADAARIIARLSEHFEIVWVSSWGHNAHTALAPILGLPDEPWTFLPVQFSKAEAVERYADGRPWILIEDAVASGSTAEWGAHVISVDPTRGLTDVDPDDVIARAAAMPTPA
ncbi:MAG TPA: HAD domain-containing protein, partial [Baekduia sp.]|nr:HAD domain-containing protein [Baekduia sp.]